MIIMISEAVGLRELASGDEPWRPGAAPSCFIFRKHGNIPITFRQTTETLTYVSQFALRRPDSLSELSCSSHIVNMVAFHKFSQCMFEGRGSQF